MARRKKNSSWKFKRPAWLHWPAWSNLKRGMLAAVWLIALAGLATAVTLGVPRLEAHAAERVTPEFIDIEFMDAPQWFRGDLQSGLVRTIEPLLTHDPFARESLVNIREALLDMGWFEEITQVRRTKNDRITIHAVYVEPFAVVRDREGDHLVDRQGRLLPRTFRAGQANSFMAVVGSNFARPARPSMVWEGADVAAGLALIAIVEAQPWHAQVVAIDVTDQLRGRPIRLITDRGSRIVWGSPPGDEGGLESLPVIKLQYLKQLHERFGHIDMGHTGEIDITKTTTIDQRP